MDWPILLFLIFGALLVLMASGMPIAFAFLLINIVGALFLWSGQAGLETLILSMSASVRRFEMLPLPLFILMGEVMYQANIMPQMIDTVDKWLGRLPGRLSLLAVAGGTIFATMSGSSMSSVAILGATLVPEMEKRGYKKPMSLGPLLGSGGLAIMIPPSGLAILLGALAKVSIGHILIGIIIPGLLMAVMYASYIIIRCRLQPHLAPPYTVAPVPLSERLMATAKYILPLGFIIFAVIGVIFAGIATPTEAAATGALSTFILAAYYRQLNWRVARKSIASALWISTMMFLIIVNAQAFANILSFSGAVRGLAQFAVELPVPPMVILIAMQAVVLVLGCLMELTSIMMITLPIFMPIVFTLGFDPVWFSVIYMLNMEMGLTSPPFGLTLFVLKGSAPPGTTVGDLYRASMPFLGLNLIEMILLILFPPLSLWLPSLMAVRG